MVVPVWKHLQITLSQNHAISLELTERLGQILPLFKDSITTTLSALFLQAFFCPMVNHIFKNGSWGEKKKVCGPQSPLGQ
jgi:antibiotic biosynthesis monooxygenase (ABM) superfamily enzyme